MKCLAKHKAAQQAAARDCTSKVFLEGGFSSWGRFYIINSSAAREPQALGAFVKLFLPVV
jgi:hypothetical protein